MKYMRILFVFCAMTIFAAEKPAKKEPFLNASLLYYHDSRDFNTYSIVVSSNRLPGDFSFWGFTDIHGDMNGNESEDLTNTFSEYRLSHSGLGKWLKAPGLGLQLEYNEFSPGSADVLRLGLTYRKSIPGLFQEKGWLQARFFPVETDDDGGQASLIYFFPFHKRFNLSGFADYNYNANKDQWVIEPQLNLKLHRRVWLMVEFRYNGYQDSNPSLDGSGTAIGIRFSL